MAVVFKPVVPPTGADGKPLRNGFLTACDLVAVFIVGVGHRSFHKFTARAISAMQVGFKVGTGYDLSSVGGYRTAGSQRQMFYERYVKTYNPLKCKLTSRRVGEDGTRWFLLRNCAPVAPIGYLGTVGFFPQSNHGLGIANDFSVWAKDVKTGVWRHHGITEIPLCWAWFMANAESYGFSWEGAHPGEPGWEPWHVRHVLGNAVSQRVLDTEAFFTSQS